jgi:hypothetical protein
VKIRAGATELVNAGVWRGSDARVVSRLVERSERRFGL